MGEEVGSPLEMQPCGGDARTGDGHDAANGDTSEWMPGIVVRLLVINVGYRVGASVYKSKNGLRTLLFVVASILVNEFSAAMVNMSKSTTANRATTRDGHSIVDLLVWQHHRRTSDDDDAREGEETFSDKLHALFTRASVIWRYFSITAASYAATDWLLRLLFDGDDDVVGIVFTMVLIFLANEIVETLTSTQALAAAGGGSHYHQRRKR